MRVLVLSIIACLAAPTAALAQYPIPNDFREQRPLLEPEPDQEFLPVLRYREVPNLSLRDGNGFRLPLGSVSLVGQGESYYPADNQKVRNDSLHLAWSLSERTDFLLGAWRYKHQHESLDDVRIVTIGLGVRHRY